MIRPDDFEIQIESETTGTRIRVKHIPTGNHRAKLVRISAKVADVRDSIVADLKRKLYRESDVRVDVGRSTSGDFIQVTHLPSGISRQAMRRERSEIDLLDEVLDELFSEPIRMNLVRESAVENELTQVNKCDL